MQSALNSPIRMSYSRTQPSTDPEMTMGPEKMTDVMESRASVRV